MCLKIVTDRWSCTSRILKADLDGLRAASAAIANGGLICYPTDTVYGLGCNPLNSAAVAKLIQAKGGRVKPLPVLVECLDAAEKLAVVSDRARLIAKEFWPGPLTIVLPARKVVPSGVAPNGTVGVRSPDNVICLNLLALCSGFLVGTSANLTGQPPATSAAEAARQLGDRVDIILDGGAAVLGIVSTVIDPSHGVAVLREGPVSREEVLRCLRKS